MRFEMWACAGSVMTSLNLSPRCSLARSSSRLMRFTRRSFQSVVRANEFSRTLCDDDRVAAGDREPFGILVCFGEDPARFLTEAFRSAARPDESSAGDRERVDVDHFLHVVVHRLCALDKGRFFEFERKSGRAEEVDQRLTVVPGVLRRRILS